MKALLKQYLSFNHWANSQYINSIIEEQIADEKIHWWMSHILNAQHVWQSRLQYKPSIYGVFQVHSAEKWQELEDALYKEGIELLERMDLDEDLNYSSTSGKAYQDKVKNIFLHFIDHSSYHRGQIAARIRTLGYEPLKANFIHWTRTSN